MSVKNLVPFTAKLPAYYHSFLRDEKQVKPTSMTFLVNSTSIFWKKANFMPMVRVKVGAASLGLN